MSHRAMTSDDPALSCIILAGGEGLRVRALERLRADDASALEV